MTTCCDDQFLAQLIHKLVHPRHGIITSLLEETEHPEARGLFIFNALMIDAKTILNSPKGSCHYRGSQHPIKTSPTPQKKSPLTSNTDRASLAGSGAAFDRSSALWAAIGESMERYSAAAESNIPLITASASELGTAAIDLNQLILFSKEQYQEPNFAFTPASPDNKRAWTLTQDLTNPEHPVYVPAQLVYLGMHVNTPLEIIQQSSSTGLACAMNLQHATMRGLAEVIERDAFACLWQLRYSPRRLHLCDSTCRGLLLWVQYALHQSALEVQLWDITTDIGLPVVLCLARNKTDGTMSLGASAHWRVEQAINKAVTEALHGYVWADTLLGSQSLLPQRHEIACPSDHFAYYLDRSHQTALHFLFDNTETIPSSAPSLHQFTGLPQLLRRLGTMGHRALVANVTSPDIAGLGFTVVRTLIPGTQPLLFGCTPSHSLDQRRLERVAHFWGIRQLPPPNPDPHPFP